MTVIPIEAAPADEPTESPYTTRTRIILAAIDRLETKITDLQDVSEAVREIQKILGVNNSWRNAIIRALRHFVSLVDKKP